MKKRRVSIYTAFVMISLLIMNNALIIKGNAVHADDGVNKTLLESGGNDRTTGSVIEIDPDKTTGPALDFDYNRTTGSSIKFRGEHWQMLLWSEDEHNNLEKLLEFENYIKDTGESYLQYFIRDARGSLKVFLGEMIGHKIPKWIEISKGDEQFKERFIDVFSKWQWSIYIGDMNIEGKLFDDLLKESLKGYFHDLVGERDFTQDEFINYSIEELHKIDMFGLNNMLYTDSIKEDYLQDIYIKKVYEGAEDFLSSDWEDKHSNEFYTELIYVLQDMKKNPPDFITSEVKPKREKLKRNTSKNYRGKSLKNMVAGTEWRDEGITSPKDALDAILDDMDSNLDGKNDRYGVYVGLDRSELSGEFLQKYQELVDNRRGIVGWYYTGINSEDYDHDTNGVEDGSRLFQEDQLVALKLEERGANFDIRNTLYGLYDEALQLESSNPAYYRGLKKVQYKAYMYMPQEGEYSIKAYLDDSIYDPRGDYEVRVTLKGLDENTVVEGKDGEWNISVQQGDIFNAEFSVEALDSDSHLPDSIKFKWVHHGTEEIIPNRYFILNDNEELNSKENLDIKHLDPIGDADMDGIPNLWEMEGFVVLGNTIAKYSEDIHGGMRVYRTSPVDKSTDGDPYTDLEEVIGANIAGVSEVGRNPLIAAYPEIVAELESVTVNARMVNKFTQKESSTTARLTSSKNTIVNKHVVKDSELKGFMVGVHAEGTVGYSYKGAASGLKVTGNKGITSEGKYEKNHDTEDTTTTISDIVAADSESSENLRTLSSKIESFRAGDLAFGIKLKNIGSASAYKIKPNVSLFIGSEIGRRSSSFSTVTPVDTFMDLSPGMTSQTVNVETSTADESKKVYLTVTRETMEKIAGGYPVSLQLNNASSEVIIDGTKRGSWDDYVNRINGITATINHQDAIRGLNKYKVFASKKDDTFRPQLSIGEALYNVYGDEFIVEDRTYDGVENPRAYIKDTPITDINIVAEDVSELKELLKNNSGEEVNIFDLAIRPSMTINIETAEEGDTRPIILNSIYKRGKVSAYVLPNCSDVEEVKAVITYNGSEKEIVLQKNEGNSLLYEYEFEEVIVPDLESNNRIVAVDENGNSNSKKLYFAEGYRIKEDMAREAFGKGYVDLDEDYVIKNNSELREFIRQHPAESYILSRNHVYVPMGLGGTRIVKKSDLENYDWQFEINSYRPAIQGYFADDGDKFKTVYNKTYKLQLRDNQSERNFELFTGINDATSYVVTFGNSSQLNFEAKAELTLNGRVMLQAGHYSDIGQRLTDFMIIDADENNPDRILGKIKSSSIKEGRKYDLQIIGYFTKGEGYNFKTLDSPIKVATFASNTKHRVERDISGQMFEPKGYIISIDCKNGGQQRETVLKINGVKFARGGQKTADNKSWLIVPKAKEEDKLIIEILNPNSDPLTNYNVEILGYFY